MKAMRLVTEGHPLEAAGLPLPPVSGKSALVRVGAAGVCHSDLHLIAGAYDLGEGRKLSTTGGGSLLPLIPGHEIAGTVEALGAESETAEVEVGDPVVVFPWIGCGQCRKCAAGRENQCEGAQRFLGFMRDGGYADHVLVPDARYLVKAQGLGAPQAAPLACAGITALSSIRKCELEPDGLVVLIGAGGVGSIAIQIVKQTTRAQVAVADLDDSRLEQASRLGADHVFNTSKTDAKEVASELKRIHGGRVADAVVDYVGTPRTASLGLRLLGHEGKLVVVGLAGGGMTLPLPMLPILGAEILGNFTGTLAQLTEMVGLAQRGAVVPVVSRSYPLEEANAALEQLQRGEIPGRAVLIP
jgi:propanol-preferring alcohol dehydrogenase